MFDFLKNADYSSAKIDINIWVNTIIAYSIKMAFALIILIGGWLVAKLLRRICYKAMKKTLIDNTLTNFLCNIIYALMIAIVIIAALNQLGVQTASLIAVIGAAGLAIGLALQGSLSNFAAGVMIIIFRHFKVGDFIEAAGVSGTVDNLDIFNTTLITPNNQKVIIPNSKLTEQAVTNFSEKQERRIELKISITHDNDIQKAKNIILNEILQNKKIHPQPAPEVAVLQLSNNSIDLVARCWTLTSEYWQVLYSLNETIKARFDQEDISIPSRKSDIRIIEDNQKK